RLLVAVQHVEQYLGPHLGGVFRVEQATAQVLLAATGLTRSVGDGHLLSLPWPLRLCLGCPLHQGPPVASGRGCRQRSRLRTATNGDSGKMLLLEKRRRAQERFAGK